MKRGGDKYSLRTMVIDRIGALFFTRIKLVASVLACARAIARIKWRRLSTKWTYHKEQSFASNYFIFFENLVSV